MLLAESNIQTHHDGESDDAAPSGQLTVTAVHKNVYCKTNRHILYKTDSGKSTDEMWKHDAFALGLSSTEKTWEHKAIGG